MNERIENELNGLATKLGQTNEQMLEKYNEIASSNNLDTENDRQAMVALTLTRNFVRGALKGPSKSSGSFGNNAFGFVVGSEPARDVQEWKRNKLVSDYNSNPNTPFNEERCAEVTLTDAGEYEKSQVKNGDVETKTIPHLPNSAIEVDENKWIVPLDNIKTFTSGDVNKNYGRPLPAEEYRRRVHVIVKKDDGTDYEYWSLGLKNEAAKEWNAEHYRWLHFNAFFTEDYQSAYAIKGRTLASLRYNDSLDPESDEYVDVNGTSMEDLLAECLTDYVADLIEIEDFHTTQKQNPGMKLVVTDGIVSSMNLNRNEKTGNCVLWIEPADVNYGYEEEDLPDSTPCWIPSNIDIDFGVGSDVIIIGRTNQTQKRDEDGNYLDDEWNPVSLNVFGILPRVALGAPNEETAEDNDVDFW